MLIEFPIRELDDMLSRLQAIHCEIRDKTESDKEYTEKYTKDIQFWVTSFESTCKKLNIDISGHTSRLKNKVRQPDNIITSLDTIWDGLRHQIRHEMSKHSFMYIPEREKEYFNQKMLFGKTVYDNFPSARKDIQEAGNCYATGSYNACVFYLMRAVEVGLKTMVRSMRAQKYITETVADTKGGRKKINKPIQLCDWQKLIDGLNNFKSDLQKGTSTNARKKAKLVFLSHSIAQFGHFKDAWRNNISHGNEVVKDRKFFFAGETKDTMDNTKHFMVHLATEIEESDATISELDLSDSETCEVL